MTKIEWCDLTINPVVGCSKISPGCDNCYAEKMARRLNGAGIKKYQSVVDQNGWTGKIGVDLTVFNNLPSKPQRIFVCSMGDLFHENVLFDDIHKIWDAFKRFPQHTFIVLTKRPHIMADTVGMIYKKEALGYANGFWSHVWLGVTAENQEQANKRVPILLQIPAAIHFISVEPMLELISIYQYVQGLDWTICGAETGHKKRHMRIEWAYDIQSQCKAAGVPFFFKKDSSGNYPDGLTREFPKASTINA